MNNSVKGFKGVSAGCDYCNFGNAIFCNECKYAYRGKDGKLNPFDIVCTYWNSDGLNTFDFCSKGERGEYEWDENCVQDVEGWKDCKKNRVDVCSDPNKVKCPYCGCLGVKWDEAKEWCCISCGRSLPDE